MAPGANSMPCGRNSKPKAMRSQKTLGVLDPPRRLVGLGKRRQVSRESSVITLGVNLEPGVRALDCIQMAVSSIM